jgi:malonyl-CoA/methylmalonyl-CoA synthetase
VSAPETEIIQRKASRPAIVAADGEFTYRDLEDASRLMALSLLGARDDLSEARVAFFLAPSFAYAAVQRGIWRAGGIAVPLAISHPPAELEYVVRDAGAECIVSDFRSASMVRPVAAATGARFFPIPELGEGVAASARSRSANRVLPHVDASRRAMIVYTSGTTGRPKGVVTTHGTIGAQISSLVSAWGWTPTDRLLLVLPLHHVHGIINGLGSALAVGATCEMHAAFDAERVWDRLASGQITVFTAVPTIYHRLIVSWEAAPAHVQRTRSEGSRRLRLMISGSAALPVQTLDRWREITGHTLLERYGMTEIGMALSNPLKGERRPGLVGAPLPDVEVRLVDEQGVTVPEGSPGEIEVRGPNVFLEYWQRPFETQQAFRDGWFRTGDMAVVEDGSYRILGRTSVDIIKTGGFKVSALEIEEVLRKHPAVAECAVVGIPDVEWGECVSAAIELRPDSSLALDELQQWARARLAPYKVPRALRAVASLPRNAMGKVLKPEVASFFRAKMQG